MIFRNISLRCYNSFGLDYKADRFISIRTEMKAKKLLSDKNSIKYPLHILGGGSNVLFTSDFNGTILHPATKGIKIEEKHPEYVIVSAGAGIIWDKFVEWSVNKGYGGLENLSLIPGMVGASPVQNIGAYGVEVRDTIVKVRTVSIYDGSIKEFSNDDCHFGYRNSIFKGKLKGQYLITKVYFKLSTNPSFNLDYGSLNTELKELGDINLNNIRTAVITIRRSKLPDPEQIGNAGSFFKNPIVSESIIMQLRKDYPEIPTYGSNDEKMKIAAGWLIEQCGWKGKRYGNTGVHEKQALVLVNYGNATGSEIYNLSEEIKNSVLKKFGIELEREVEVIGSI